MALPDKVKVTSPPEVETVTSATLGQFAGYHMKRAFNVIQTDLNASLKPFGLRMLTFTALVLIVENRGLRQSQLASAMAVERPNLVVILDDLENRGLIVRERIPSDRRAYALMPTPTGKALHDNAITAVKAHEAKLFSSWTAETRDTVIDAMCEVHSPNNEA